MKIVFQDRTMQGHYEMLVKDGMHYRKAMRVTEEIFKAYDSE